ncbi:MAG: hypothetical protein ABJA66_17330 [Actinomycetota bacterium]
MLQRKVFLTVVFIASFLFALVSAAAQTVKSDALYWQPERLKLNGVGEPNPKAKEDDYNQVMTEPFYPIGWSEDGKFAYYVEPADEACGCYYGTLVIQDLKTDKILWKDKYSGGDNEPVNENETIKDHWKDKQKLFYEKLAEYGIKQQKQFTLNYPSLKFENDLLTPKLEMNIKTDGNFYVDGTVKLLMISKSKGKKTIYEERYKPKDTNGFRGAEVSGVLLSPFEARAAVVVIEVNRGYEGPPNVASINIVGSTLTTGFR